MINRALMDVAFGGVKRLIVNIPAQHGKSWLCSHYFPAWLLLLFPHMRIMLASFQEGYSATFGAKVREVIQRFGADLGINLKSDTKAKNEWRIDGFGGGMVCKGRHGAIIGRPADLLLLDDICKDHAEAMSAAISESTWDWYITSAYPRLSRGAPIVIVNTRWHKRDLCGRILEKSKQTKEQWQVLKFTGIAEENDILGRKPGEALWPDLHPLAELLISRENMGRWWSACCQQNPEDEMGANFRPRKWPLYADTGDAYVIEEAGQPRQIVLKIDMMIFVTVDWAWSVKSSADHTAIGVFGLTPDGKLLILEMKDHRYRPEELAPALAAVCRLHRPATVAVETGHPTLSTGYRKYPEIPEIRWINPESKDKLFRALNAIVMAENGRILLPKVSQPWQERYIVQMSGFTGMNDDEDDMVDATSMAAKLAQQLRMAFVTHSTDAGPTLLTAGREDF